VRVRLKATLTPSENRASSSNMLTAEAGAIANARAYCSQTGAEAIEAFSAYPSSAFEFVFLEPPFFQQAAAAAHRLNRRAWANTLQPGHAAGLVDADAVVDPEAIWGTQIDLGADIIQTDYPRELMAYLKNRGPRASPLERGSANR
jgi:16S rRNA G966 N2-methylase RsmD